VCVVAAPGCNLAGAAAQCKAGMLSAAVMGLLGFSDVESTLNITFLLKRMRLSSTYRNGLCCNPDRDTNSRAAVPQSTIQASDRAQTKVN
jgi:hypothetical protein